MTEWLWRICTSIVPDHSPPVEAANSLPVEGCQAPPDGVVASYLHQLIPLLWRGGKRSLTGWLPRICTRQFPSCGGVASEALTGWLWRVCASIVSDHSPPVEGCQAPPDGVVAWVLYQLIPLLWRGGKRSLTGWLRGVSAQVWCWTIPFLWRGVRPVHFVVYAFSNYAEVLHNVTPFVLLQQSAVLSDGVVVAYLYKYSAGYRYWRGPSKNTLTRIRIPVLTS